MRLDQGLALEAFVTTLIERRGGVVQTQGEGLYTALITPDLSDGDEKNAEDPVTLAFDPDQAREIPEARMVTYGSPLLDRWIGEGVPWCFETTVFSFRASFRSDEREEERRYAVARSELARSLLSDLQSRKLSLEARRERELDKVGRYFDQSQAELAEELQDAGDDPERSGQLLGKIAAVRAERARQLSQIRAKHALSVHVSLSSALEVWQPKVVFPCRIEAPRIEAVELPLVWDPLLETWLAPPCPSCGKPTTRLAVERFQGLSCPLCEKTPLQRSARPDQRGRSEPR